MKIRLILFAFVVIAVTSHRLSAETYYSPISGITASSFSSAFGPRNLTTNNAEYPNQGYDYDFHAGIDIASPGGTNVYAVSSGTVYSVGSAQSDDDFVIVRHQRTDGSYFLTKYLHIRHAVSTNANVSATITVLGTIINNHLDIRYFPDGKEEDLDKNADNPGKILAGVSQNTFETSGPVFVDKYGFSLTTTSLYTEKDEGSDFGNPTGAEYFSVGVRIDRKALNVHGVQAWLTAVDGVNWYHSQELLDNAKNNPKAPEYEADDLIWYYSDDPWLRKNFPDRWRISCGDLASNDDDNGHVSKTVGIYPRELDSQNGTHTVYFRWYINAALWSQLKNKNIPVYVELISDPWNQKNISDIYSIRILTCIDCPHPTGVPGAPNLTTATYDPQGKVKLQWTPTGSNPPDFYKIYRCPSDRNMTDLDVVDISASTGFFDCDIQLSPGIQYKYAVAGVNQIGEGPNSNTATVLFGQQLPSNITSNTTLSGGWYTSNSVTIPYGVFVNVNPGARFSMGPGCSIYSYGKLVVNGSGMPVIFAPFNQTLSPGCWGSIVLSGVGASGSTLNSVKMNYGTQIDVLNGANNITISNCSISENSGHGINASNSSYLTVSDNTIANSNVNHGILINGGYTNNCYRNVIYKTNHNKQGAGIQYGGANGTVEQNDIDYYNWGIAGIWGADIDGGYSSNNGRNNRVTNCQYGLMIYRQSNGEFGTMSNPGSGWNSIYNNVYYNAAVGMSYPTYSSLLYGEYNWWGANPPDANKFYTSPACTTYFWYPRSYDPWGTRPLPSAAQLVAAKEADASLSVSDACGPVADNEKFSDPSEVQNASRISDQQDSLLIGAMLRSQDKRKQAGDFFMSFIRRHPDNQAAYVMLNSCADNETTPVIIDFFKSLPAQASREHKLLLANLYLRQRDVRSAKEVNNSIINENINTPLGTRAKLNNFYIALYNDNDPQTAASILKDVKRKPGLSAEMELSTAEWALKSYVDPKSGKMPYSFSMDGSSEELEVQLPEEGGMIQNYPNPFNPTTAISYRLPVSGRVELKVYDILGREVVTLVSDYQEAGIHTAYFNGQNLASGVYFYRLTAPGISQVKKMLMVK